MKLLRLAQLHDLLLSQFGKRWEAGLHNLYNDLLQGFYLAFDAPFCFSFSGFLFDKVTFF